uniref:Innexin n=1 Tax=Mesocestoides corti TaxID=53468 RepID=A0A5K3F5W9_MESCO
MVGIEFIDYLSKLRVNDFLGVEDFADKMSFMYSVLILLLSTTVIAVKQYLLASIACYIPTVPSGKDFDKFLQNFCWVHGTIPLLEGEHIPQNYSEWHEADQNLRINFMNFYQKYQVATLIGIQDWADRMSYAHSTIIFLLCTAIVSAKTYILSPLACHVPTVPSGSDFDSYFDSYCWVHGTTPIRMNETIPEDDVAWTEFERERKITYYQWVPFILGLQTILFYLPHVAWQNITFNRLGADLTAIIVKAMDALKTTSPSKRETMVANVAKRLELLLFAHRDFRRGKKAALKRRLHAACGIFLVSKRMGTWTVFSYLCIKILYLVNAVGQLYLMKHFLGYGEDMVGFGLTIAHSLVAGIKWRESLFFPRVAFCSVTVRHLGQKTNRYMGMCALAINMLNEKLYVFLWFWTLAVAIATFVSLINWFLRLAVRRRQASVIRKYLKLAPIVDKPEKEGSITPLSLSESLDPGRPDTVERFIHEFLRLDGVFIVHMLTMNAGDVITGEVIRLLWHTWVTKYADKKDFGNDPWIEFEYPEEEEMDEIDKAKMELAEREKSL